MITKALHCRFAQVAALITAIAIAAAAQSGHAASTLVINGVDGELANNIRLLVAKPPEKQDERKFKRYIDGLPEQVVTALSAYGYYAAEATISVAEVAAEQPENAAGKAGRKVEETVTRKTPAASLDVATVTQISINVVPNEPVRIRDLTLRVSDNEGQEGDFKAVRAGLEQLLSAGNIFVSANYESAKSTLLNTAQELGYFDFEFTSTAVRVSRKAGTADITIIASTGKRFSFGEIQFKQRAFSETFMSRWSPFEAGDPYEASLIGELTQNLQSSGYFSSVRVRPLIDPRYEQTVPVIVDLTQRDDNQVAIGVGYSSDTEFRTKLTYGKPLLNSNGHSAEVTLGLSRDTKNLSFAYRIPRENQPLFNFWGIEYGLQDQTLEDGDSFLSTLNFQRVTRTPKNWSEALFIRWERERFEVGNVEQTTDLVLPGISYARNRSKGSPFPTWGQSLSFQLLGGSKDVLSTIDIVKAVARYRYLRAVADKHTLIGTMQYGVINSNDYDRVPLSHRFFAGGDRTVRGYAFRDISPRNPQGKATGGRFMEVVNLEYNYRFRDNWSAAIFTDAGRAFNAYSQADNVTETNDDNVRFDNTRFGVGAGVGVRWQSPVGPFRIDIATPFHGDNEGGVRVHLSLGPDL